MKVHWFIESCKAFIGITIGAKIIGGGQHKKRYNSGMDKLL